MSIHSKNITFDNYGLAPSERRISHKYINNSRLTNENTTFKSKMEKKEESNFSSGIPKSAQTNKYLKKPKMNFNISESDYFSPYDKDYSYRNDYQKTSYFPDNFSSYQYDYQTDMALKRFTLYSQVIESKPKNHQKEDYLFEEKNYPSNYSYYEYRYTKEAKDEPKKIIININKNKNKMRMISKYGNLKFTDKNNLSNVSSNLNSSKMHIINQKENSRYGTTNTPNTTKTTNNYPVKKKSKEGKQKTKETFYYRVPKDKINQLSNSAIDNTKRNVLKNSFNLNRNKPVDNYKSKFAKAYNQPKTPSLIPKNPIKIQSPDKKDDLDNDKLNRSERNIPSKSSDKISFRKIILFQPQNKNNLYKNKFHFLEEDKGKNKNNITEPFKLKMEKLKASPKEFKMKNFTKFNKISDKNKYNNNFTISIKETNEANKTNEISDKRNILKNMRFNTEVRQKIKENIKSRFEMPKKRELDIMKESKLLVSEKRKKNYKIKGLKIKDTNISFPSSIISKSNIIYKSRNTEAEKKNQAFPKEKNNKAKNESKNIKDEKEYLKEIERIMHDNFTEPNDITRYTFKGNRNTVNNANTINNANNMNSGVKLDEIFVKRKKDNNIIKGRIKLNKEKYKSQDFQSIKEIKNYTKDIKPTKEFNLLSRFDNYRKSKSKDFTMSNTFNKANINLNNNDNLKKNNSNRNLAVPNKISNIVIMDSQNKSKSHNNYIIKINSPKKAEKPEKINPTPSFSKTTKFTSFEKNQKPRLHRNLSELPKHESRLDDITKKLEEKKKEQKIEEDWDKMHFKGMRKKTYDVGLRPRKDNKKSNRRKNESLKEHFSSTVFVKASEGLSLAGRYENGSKKINQDAYIIERNVNGVLNFNIFGVFDGHGDVGHLASQFVKRYIVYRIKNHPLIKKLDEPKEIYNQIKTKGYQLLSNIFVDADTQIQKEKFDSKRSGTTVVLVIQLEEHIICANAGDSRALAIYDDKNDDNLANSKIYRLSYDCKPNLPNEKRRIIEAGGVVEKAYYSDADSSDEEFIPFRVWVKDKDYPGLAMSRSIGDMDAKKVGVIPNPQIVEYTIDWFSKYLLICSDGIWEFMSNEDAMKIANKFYLRNDAKGLCHELIQSSIKLWEEMEIVIDDITVLVVFF